MKNIFIFFLLLFPTHLYATSVNKIISIEKIELFVDSSKSMRLKDVMNVSAFQPVKNGYGSPNKMAHYWFRIRIKSHQSIPEKYYLTINSGAHFYLDCYYFNKSLLIQKAGMVNKKEISHRNSNPAFEVSIPANTEVDVYVKNISQGAAENFFFDVMTEKAFNQDQQKRQFVFGFFYGILILIFIINLFYYFSLKQKAFLFYSIYILFTFLLCSYSDGIPLLGLLNTVGTYHNAFLFTFTLCHMGFLPLMTIYYLQLENQLTLLKTSFIYFFFTVFCSLITFLWNNNAFIEASYLYHSITILTGIVLVAIMTIKGLKVNKILGRSFLVAMFIMILSVIITYTEAYGITTYKVYFDLIKLGSLIEIIILSLTLALHFRGLKNDLIVKNDKLDILSHSYGEKEKEFFNLENRFLSSQMNPHFTFNAMNSILHFMLENESEKAQSYLTKYSKLIRKVLENNMNKYVSLEDEITMLRLYLDMEKTRLIQKFEFEIILSPDINGKNYIIPPMLIQPFIENAIWHGISHKTDGMGMVSLSFEISGDYIKCIIEDNGIGREKAKEFKPMQKEHNSVGMAITQQRLEHIQQQNKTNVKPTIFDLTDENNAACGTKVEIFLPVQNE